MKHLLMVIAILANHGLLPDTAKPIHAGWRGSSIQYGVDGCEDHFRVINKFVQNLNVSNRKGNELSFSIQTTSWSKKNNLQVLEYSFRCSLDKSYRGKSLHGSKYYFSAWSLLDFGFMDGVTAYKNGDYTTAFKKFREWAEQGDKQAQFKIGYMYQNGQGVVQNYKEAVSWFRKAAEQEYEKAQYSLALIYGEGKGVTQDYKEAARWYRKAAIRGHARAQYNLGQLFLRGDGVVKDYKEASRWFRKAANRRIVQAQNNLGAFYLQGMGVVQDYVQAHSWFYIAEKHGHQKAKENRARVEKLMTTAQIVKAQKLAKKWMEKHKIRVVDKPLKR